MHGENLKFSVSVCPHSTLLS